MKWKILINTKNGNKIRGLSNILQQADYVQSIFDYVLHHRGRQKH